MFRPALRPLAQVARASRAYSTRPTPHSTTFRNTVLASVTLAVGALAYTSHTRPLLAATNPDVRVSVLDQPSLKDTIHKRRECLRFPTL